uniref:FtsX-like permease family protein n=1 Tax=Parolsenella massiliensis TaxID=1871022 RepID=UPI000932B83D|nr:ABC transporter permease [Parolsenella massiliensis]
MLCKLAWGNVARARRDYLIYLLTLTLGVTVFYAFNTISLQVDLAGVDIEGLGEVLGELLSGLTVFLGAVMGFLMVYANNFIMKRRNKEFGLYQVLGMTRGQVARIMALETVIVSVAALVLGIILGVGLSQLMVFFTASLFKTQIANFRFIFSTSALALTVGCLATIFLVTLVFNLRVVRKSCLIDLMGSGRRNESVKTRNPLLAGLVCLLGAVLIGAAYSRLLHDGLPITARSEELKAAMTQFEITTGMVTLGTVLFFFGLSGLLLKLLQTVRDIYWRGLNAFTLRQLSAKVNTVSLSMAIISMILFLAITSVTTGMSIVSATSNAIERVNPVDFSQSVWYNESTGESQDGDGNPEHYVMPDRPIDAADELRTQGIDIDSVCDSPLQLDLYFSLTKDEVLQIVNDADTQVSTPLNMNSLSKASGAETPAGMENSNADVFGLSVMKESQYNQLLAYCGKPEVNLDENGYLITCDMGNSITDFYDKVLASGVTISLGGHELTPAAQKVDVENSALADSAMGSNAGTIIVPDDVVDDAHLQIQTSNLLINYNKPGVGTEQGDKVMAQVDTNHISYSPVHTESGIIGYWGTSTTRTTMYATANTTNGAVSYLAIYIGFVLVIACAAILAIQQLSGVSDASRNYRVLSELGCDKSQIAHSVLAQQTVFFLFPLVIGIAHSLVALKVVIDLVRIFGGLTISGMVGFTCAIFLAAYGGYFLVTYVMSRGIVNDAIRIRYAA